MIILTKLSCDSDKKGGLWTPKIRLGNVTNLGHHDNRVLSPVRMESACPFTSEYRQECMCGAPGNNSYLIVFESGSTDPLKL